MATLTIYATEFWASQSWYGSYGATDETIQSGFSVTTGQYMFEPGPENGSYYNERRGFIKFGSSLGLPAGAAVTSAYLQAETQSGAGAYVYNLTTAVPSTSAGGWSSNPSLGGYLGQFPPSPSNVQAMTLTITSQVQSWAAGAAYHGLGFVGVSEPMTSIYVTPSPPSYNNQARIVITYEYPPTAPGAITEPDIGATYNVSITLDCGAATDSDTSASNLQYAWEYSANGGGSWSTVGSLTAAGITSKVWDVSALAAGTAYRVRVRAYDGSNYGAYTTLGGNFAIFRQTHQVIM